MRQHGNVAVALLGVVAALGMIMAGVALFFQMQEHDLRMARERELAIVKAEKQDLEQQLTEARDANTRIERQLADVKADLEEAARSLSDERTAKEQLAKTAEERQQQMDRMLEDLDRARGEQRSLTDQLAKVRQQQDALQKQLSMLRDDNAQLEQQVVELSTHPTVELDRVVVNSPHSVTVTQLPSLDAPSSAASPATELGEAERGPSLDILSGSGIPRLPGSQPLQSPEGEARGMQGQVIVVNREYDFIVVNLGSNQGLTLGQEFHIVRGEQVLGRVKVEKLYDELSAAAILPNSNKDAIHEGDAVRPI